MRPPNEDERKTETRPSQNGASPIYSNNKLSRENGSSSKTDSDWDQQKTRIDGLLSTLKKEMLEVKVMDKNLIRQFVHLGGKIQEVKAVEKQLFEQMSLEDESFDNEDELINDNNNETSVTVLEDTRL